MICARPERERIGSRRDRSTGSRGLSGAIPPDFESANEPLPVGVPAGSADKVKPARLRSLRDRRHRVSRFPGVVAGARPPATWAVIPLGIEGGKIAGSIAGSRNLATWAVIPIGIEGGKIAGSIAGSRGLAIWAVIPLGIESYRIFASSAWKCVAVSEDLQAVHDSRRYVRKMDWRMRLLLWHLELPHLELHTAVSRAPEGTASAKRAVWRSGSQATRAMRH